MNLNHNYYFQDLKFLLILYYINITYIEYSFNDIYRKNIYFLDSIFQFFSQSPYNFIMIINFYKTFLMLLSENDFYLNYFY
jgi:hypothetical protein